MKKLTVLSAIKIAKAHIKQLGAGPMEAHDRYVAAFQFLIDEGVAWSLQGWLVREAADLIDAGFCMLPENTPEKDVLAIEAIVVGHRWLAEQHSRIGA